MTISSDPATAGEKWLKTDYPHEIGLSGATTKQTGENLRLMPEETLVYDKEMIGLT